MPETLLGSYSPTRLKNIVYEGKKAPNIHEVPTRFFRISVNCFPIVIPIGEITDSEILSFSEKMGTFAFLEDREEDIYTPSDGQPPE